MYRIFIKTRFGPGCAEALIGAIQANTAVSVPIGPDYLVFDVSRS